MSGVNASQCRGGKSRVQVCAGLHGPQPPPAGPCCGDWSTGAERTRPVGHSFLLGSLGMRFQEKKQMRSHDCSKHGLNPSQARAGRAVPPAVALASLLRTAELHPHICVCTPTSAAEPAQGPAQGLPLKVLFKTFPGSKETKDYAPYFQAIRHRYGGERKVPIFTERKGEGRKILPSPKLAVMRVCLKAGL